MSAVAAPFPPAPPSAPTPAPLPPLRWTVDLFHQVNATGVFAGRRPVLIRGVLLEQGPMNSPHANGVVLVTEAVRAALGAGWVFRARLPLVLGQDTDPLPDLAVIPGTPRSYPGHPKHPTTAALVVEVADTTLFDDTTTKAELYAAAGIPDYWVLDLTGRRLLVFRDPAPVPANGNSHLSLLTLGPADTVSPLAAPAAVIRVADLLP